MGHFRDRLIERAPHIDSNTLNTDIIDRKKAGGKHDSFTYVCTTATGGVVFRYVQASGWCYLVLSKEHGTFCTVYTQEHVSNSRRAAKKRKRNRSNRYYKPPAL